MEFRQLGASGFKVPALSLGTGTFGGSREFFKAWGNTDAQARPPRRHLPRGRAQHVRQRRRLLRGLAEEILGGAIKGRRDDVIISTKATFRWARAPTTSAPRATT